MTSQGITFWQVQGTQYPLVDLHFETNPDQTLKPVSSWDPEKARQKMMAAGGGNMIFQSIMGKATVDPNADQERQAQETNKALKATAAAHAAEEAAKAAKAKE